MKTLFLPKLLFKYSKFWVFNLTFFIVVLFSVEANLSLKQSKNDYHDRLPFNIKLNEPSSLLLLGVGLFELAGATRKKFKKNL